MNLAHGHNTLAPSQATSDAVMAALATIDDDEPRSSMAPVLPENPAVLKKTQKFFDILAGENDPIIRFEAIHPGTGAIHHVAGMLATQYQKLQELNAQGYGVYHAVNVLADSNGKRNKGTVIKARACTADFDKKDFLPERGKRDGCYADAELATAAEACVAARDRAIARCEPNFIVESSPGCFHLYWVTEAGKDELGRVEAINRSIAGMFGADPSTVGCQGLLRTPGFLHTKQHPVLSTVLIIHDRRYSLEELAGAFGEAAHVRSAPALGSGAVLDTIPDHVRQRLGENAANERFSAGIHATGVEDLRELFSWINPDSDYSTWRMLVAVIKAELNGSDESLTLADVWSSGGLIHPTLKERHTAHKYAGSDVVAAKWNGCRGHSQEGDATLGTAITLAREAGYTGHISAVDARLPDPTTTLNRLAPPRLGAVNAPAPVGFGAVSVETAPSVFRRLFRSAFDMMAEPVSPDWLIHGVIEKGSTVMMFGPSGAGKSFVGLDMGLSIATAHPWHGHGVNNAGLVLYMAGEGRHGLSRRLRAWSIARGVDLENARLEISSVTVPFDAEGGELLKRAMAELPEQPVLIIVDTLARHLVGDENSQRDAGQFIQVCDQITQASGAAVMIVHHSGHQAQDRARGSSALRAAVDVELSVTPQGDGRGFQLGSTKVKDGAPLPLMDFQLRVVELGTMDVIGQQVVSAVPHFVGTAVPKPPGRPAKVPEVVDLVRQREGATIEELRPEWIRLGNESRRLKEALERARRGGFLRCDAGKWWPA
jgi:hypothetical protein